MAFLRFIAAVVVGIIGGLFWMSKPWHRVQSAVDLLWHSRNEKNVSDKIYNERMSYCRDCPIFFSPLQTCGSPLRNHDLGCWCSMWAKAKLKGADCWLRSKGHSNLMRWAWPKRLQE